MNPATDPAPDSFGPYEVFERLGMGGMAMVHRAKKRGIEGFERSVALKRMLQHLAEDGNFVESFIREAKVASLLHHPNIAQVYDFGRISGVYYIAMELVTGFDVRKLLRYANKSGESIPMPVLLSILGEMADALEYAHTFADESGRPLKIVHRDISPSNLIVAHTGHIKVIDFGIAKASTAQLHTESGQVKGKLGYMSPEAALGMPLDPVSDIFSMGVVAWELVTASPLFSARTDYETMRRIREAAIPPPSYHNPACPPELDAIIMSALARDAELRLPSAGVFRAALDALATQHGIHSSARHVAEWITRFAQPGDGWVRPSTQGTSKPSLPLPPEQVTVANRKRSAPSAKLQRSSEQQQLATEIWGEDMPVMTQSPAGPDFSVQVARPSKTQPPPLTNTLPPLIPHSQPMPLANVPMYTPTQHPPPRAKASKKAIAILLGLAAILAVLVTILILKPKKEAAPAKASVHFVVEPKDSTISVAGKPVGEDVKLEAGAYAVTIEHAQFKTWTRDIVVKAGEGQTVNVSLEREQVAIATPPKKPVDEIEMPETPTKKPTEKPEKRKPTEKKKPEVAETKPVEPKPEEPKPVEPPKPVDKPVEPPKPVEKPVEPPKPEKPKVTPVVSASAVTKLSGEIPKLKSSGGESNGDALAKMCIDEGGKVTSVKIVKSTAAIASELQAALLSWRYKPFVNKDGETQPVCFPLQLRLVFKRAD